MALFKTFRGLRTSLDAQEKHDGYAYFCTDDGSFHIDYVDANGILQRKQINAREAETLTGKTLEEIKKSINWEDVIGKPTLGALASKDKIVNTDLALSIQESLDKADSALQSYAETDPTVPAWAKASTKPTYTAAEVGALPNTTVIPTKLSDLTADSTHRVVTDTEKSTWNAKANVSDIPTKVSQLTNDSKYLTSYTETDPTVPSWAKASSKPSYTKSEVGLGNVDNVKQYSASNPPPYPVTSVNSKTGAVSLTASDVSAVPTTRTVNNKALSSNITLSASDVGADASGTASSAVSAHNNSGTAHADIRNTLETLGNTVEDIQNNTIHYIVGNGTTAGVWTGTCTEISEYYDGLTVLYKVNIAGVSGGTTLNINNLGAVTVNRNASTAVTTTYPVGSVVLLTYSAGAWLTADYDANTKNTAGTSNKVDTKMYLVGAASQTSSGTTTYTNKNAYIGTDNRLYSAGAVVPNSAEITSMIESSINPIEASIGQLSSEIEDLKAAAGYTNRLLTAKNITNISEILTGTDGSVGYLNGYRVINGQYNSHSDYDATGLIPAHAGDIIRLKNVTMKSVTTSSGYGVTFNDASGTYINNASLMQGGTIAESATFDADGNIIQFTVPTWNELSNMEYLYIVCQDINENSIITVNEEIPEDSIEVRIAELDTRVTALENIGGASSSEDIPSYVVTEAESVIDRVIAAQGNRSFTFAAITDMHYGNGSYTDGVKHACQAMKYIDKRIKLDAVAILGDYTDGYPSTGIENAMGDFKSINIVLDSLRFANNLRQQGNHDYYPDNIPITRRLIQSYSNDVVWGDRLGGYYYKDFENYKIRIICPNTNENNPIDTSNNHPSSSVSMTATQINWLINTLDISAKSDAEEWGILILSHQPLDYWTSDSVYVLGHILHAYKTGGSWSGNGFSCNYANKNKAKLIGNIHGHIHNLLTAYMFRGSPNNNTRSEVYRSCVPNACYDRENQYTGTWGESTTYGKTKNSANDTAFMVYVIDLDTFDVNGICYGAGADRHFNYGEVAPEIFTITSNFTNITSNNSATTIEEGQPYTATLTPAGASITSVVVTMGGVNVTSSVYSNGVISIPSVTGNIVITAVGEAPLAYINQIPLSITSTGAQYVGDNGEDGYRKNYRLNSSGVETAATGVNVTGFIPVKRGDTIYFKNVKTATNTGGLAENTYFVTYNASFTKKRADKFNTINSGISTLGSYYSNLVKDASGYVTSLTIADKYDELFGGNGGYFRVSAEGLDNNSIITVNQPID